MFEMPKVITQYINGALKQAFKYACVTLLPYKVIMSKMLLNSCLFTYPVIIKQRPELPLRATESDSQYLLQKFGGSVSLRRSHN